jgi:hypothetical protein
MSSKANPEGPDEKEEMTHFSRAAAEVVRIECGYAE